MATPLVLEAQSASAGTFIDVRARDAFAEVHAEGFLNIPHYELLASLSQVPKGPVYLLDHYGFYSEQAAKVLEANDYHDVRVVEGGLLTWTFRGGPVTSSHPPVAAKLKRNRGVTATLPAVEAAAQELGVSVDLSERVFPHIDRVFDSKEDRAEAISKSWVKRK